MSTPDIKRAMSSSRWYRTTTAHCKSQREMYCQGFVQEPLVAQNPGSTTEMCLSSPASTRNAPAQGENPQSDGSQGAQAQHEYIAAQQVGGTVEHRLGQSMHTIGQRIVSCDVLQPGRIKGQHA